MSRRTIEDVAAQFRPWYEAARTDEERRAVLADWDAALEGAEQAPVESDDLDAVIERTRRSWASSGRRGER